MSQDNSQQSHPSKGLTVRDALHVLTMRITRIFLWFSNRAFDAKLFYLGIKHGGRKNIPIEVYGFDGKTGGMDQLIKTMKITSALQDIGKKFGMDFMSFEYATIMSAFLNGKLEIKEEYDDVMLLREMDKNKVRREVFNRLIKYGDITERKVDFMFSGTMRADFEDWLDCKPIDN